MFPDISAAEPALAPVLERLSAEHEVISGLLVRLDEAVVALVADRTMVATTSAAADRLAQVLCSHLAYEEVARSAGSAVRGDLNGVRVAAD